MPIQHQPVSDRAGCLLVSVPIGRIAQGPPFWMILEACPIGPRTRLAPQPAGLVFLPDLPLHPQASERIGSSGLPMHQSNDLTLLVKPVECLIQERFVIEVPAATDQDDHLRLQMPVSR